MLTLTDSAVETIRDIVDSPQVPEGAGLRIASRTSEDTDSSGPQEALEASFASAPAEDDQVVTEQGAHVFLDPGAAEYLEHKQLDIRVVEDQLGFTISDQPA